MFTNKRNFAVILGLSTAIASAVTQPAFAAAAAQTITCPSVADKLTSVPAAAQAEVDSNLALLDKQIVEANRRLQTSVGQGGPNFVQNAILGPLKSKRVATIDRIGIAIGRTGAQRPAGLAGLENCTLGGAADGGAGAGAGAGGGAGAGAGAGGGAGAGAGAGGGAGAGAATPTITCPSVADKLGNVPAQAKAEVDRNLALLETQIADANKRIVDTVGQGGPNFIQNAILGPLKSKRVATIDRIGIAIGRTGAQRPAGLAGLENCTLNAAGGGSGATPPGGNAGGGGQTAVGPVASDFIDIRKVQPNVRRVGNGQNASQGTFAARCGNNANGHRNPDNFIVAPGVSNGAKHTHDYVGNLSTDGFSTDQSLKAAGTTCTQGDKSAYFWPVLRDRSKGGDGGDGNVGQIVTPQVRLEFSGNAQTKVRAMPRFLRVITGDAKVLTNGTANARAKWTCTGFTNRVTDKYPICPGNSNVVRILEFASCLVGNSTDSPNHRTHILFPNAQTGACPAGSRAVPKLTMTLTYRVGNERNMAVDSFPEQLHNPATDHADFANVMPTRLMNRVVSCINRGQRC